MPQSNSLYTRIHLKYSLYTRLHLKYNIYTIITGSAGPISPPENRFRRSQRIRPQDNQGFLGDDGTSPVSFLSGLW